MSKKAEKALMSYLGKAECRPIRAQTLEGFATQMAARHGGSRDSHLRIATQYFERGELVVVEDGGMKAFGPAPDGITATLARKGRKSAFARVPRGAMA